MVLCDLTCGPNGDPLMVLCDLTCGPNGDPLLWYLTCGPNGDPLLWYCVTSCVDLMETLCYGTV